MTDQELTEKLKSRFGDTIVEISNPARRRVFFTVRPKDLEPVFAALRKDFGYTHLSTISGVDKGDVYEIVYHLGDAHGNLNVRTQIPKADAHLPSICAVIPGAILYERELQDMFGIVVDRIPDPRPLVMPDDWPAGNFPLRKDWKFERPQEIIPGGKK
jgi:NADH:ubiquinone oxidoreductase subunit C